MDYLIVIDDEPELSRFVGRVGESVGYRVEATSRVSDFKELVGRSKPHVIVLDLAMPDADGLELLRWLAAENCQAYIIIMSGFDTQVIQSAKEIGRARGLKIAFTFTKPIRLEELKKALESLHTVETIVTEAELDLCLSEREFIFFYQPRVSLENGRLDSVEMMLQWRHPSRWTMDTDHYVKLAEEAGLTRKLTRFVMAEAVYQHKFWAQQKLNTPIAVHLSGSDLRYEPLADELEMICQGEGVGMDKIILEVAEETVMQPTLEIFDALTRLRLKGFSLSIDNFGAGFLSLRRLQRLPVREVKIAASIASDVLVSKDAVMVTKTLIDVIHHMNMDAVADGMESVEHYQKLADLGCDIGQGMGIAKMMPADEFLAWSQRWQPSPFSLKTDH